MGGANIKGSFHDNLDIKISILMFLQRLMPASMSNGVYTHQWIEGILSLPEAKRREIYDAHSHCSEKSLFMVAVSASLPECHEAMLDNFEEWPKGALRWMIPTWEKMQDFESFYAMLAPLSPQDILRTLPFCSSSTRRQVLVKKQTELLSLCDEAKEEQFTERLAILLSRVRADSPVEELREVRSELYKLQQEINQIVGNLRPWSPEGDEETSGLDEDELVVVSELVSMATGLQEKFSSQIKDMLTEVESYLPKGAPPPTIAEEAEEDNIAFLGKWDGEFFLPDFYPRKIQLALGCHPEELSKRGIAEGRDCHLLGLTNELRYLIEEAEETHNLERIQEWRGREREKLVAIFEVISKAQPRSMGVTSARQFFDLLSRANTVDPGKISDFLKMVKNMDKAFKTFCLRAYLAQPGIETRFEGGAKSLSDLHAAVTEPAQLYNLSSL